MGRRPHVFVILSLLLLGVFLLAARWVKPCPIPPQDYDPDFWLERSRRPRFTEGEFDQRLGEDKPPEEALEEGCKEEISLCGEGAPSPKEDGYRDIERSGET